MCERFRSVFALDSGAVVPCKPVDINFGYFSVDELFGRFGGNSFNAAAAGLPPTKMKTINLEKFRKARVWINELPDASYHSLDVISHSVPVGSRGFAEIQTGAVELFVPLGARSMYGLIGGYFEPMEGDNLSVEICISSSCERLLSENLAGSSDEVRVGLPAEYVGGVVAGIDVACSRLKSIATGKIHINCAAHGVISSSESIYTQITIALINLFHCDEAVMSDSDLMVLF